MTKEEVGTLVQAIVSDTAQEIFSIVTARELFSHGIGSEDLFTTECVFIA